MKIQVKWIASYIVLASLFSVGSVRSVSALDISQELADSEAEQLAQASQDDGSPEQNGDDVEADESEADESEADDEGDTLRIVVTATRTEQNVLDVPRSVTIVDREDIEQQLNFTNNLPDILGKLVPGLAPPAFDGSTSQLQLRGRPLSIFIDGVPQTPNANGNASDLRVIDPALIERIEVLRGPSAVYGDGGAGGIVNIITRRPTEESLVYEIDLRTGTSLTQIQDDSFFYSGRIGVSASDEKADGRIDFSYDVLQSQFDADGDRIIPTNVSDTDRLGLLVSGGYNFTDEQRLGLTYSFYRDTLETDFIPDESVTEIPGLQKGRAFEFGDVEYEREPEQINHVFNLTYRHEDILGSTLDTQLYYRDRELVQRFTDSRLNPLSALFPLFPDLWQTTLDSSEFGGRFQLDTPLGESASLLWGADYADESNDRPVLVSDNDDFDNNRQLNIVDDSLSQTGEYTIESIGLFAQGSWDISDQWQISGGVRYENFDVSVEDYSLAFVTQQSFRERQGGDRSFDDVAFNAGLIYRPISEIGLFANFAQGFSVPDITSILGNAFTVVDISDELLLEPQKVDNYEVGVRADFDRVQLSLSGFYNESDLGTNFSVDPEGFAVPVRAPQRNYGVEATLDWQPSDIWRLGGTFSWNEGENDENDDGDFIALSSLDIKPFKVSVYVENETTPGWTNRLELLGVGSRDRGFNARNDLGLRVDETDIDGYITLDFLSSIKLNPGTLTLGVTNLLNNQYLPAGSQTLTQPGIEARRVAAPGIRFSLGYSVEF